MKPPESIFIVDQRLREELQRNGLCEREVFCAVHLTHATFAEH